MEAREATGFGSRAQRADYQATADPALNEAAEELGPIMRAAPTEDQKVFLCTQIADEARHVRFFERFYREVGVLESEGLAEMLAETAAHLNDNFGRLFDEMLGARTERLSAEPED